MRIFREPAELQEWTRTRRLEGATIALVPTMGYLHEGHMSLIAAAKARGADEIVVSVFVNPVQFGPNEDYATYPRDEEADLVQCRAAGATAIFFPTPANMYLKRHSVYVTEDDVSKGYCGARRPGHFRGVCTVVAKLFNLAHPTFAVFGQKDYQQVQVIRRMVRDLNFDLNIVTAPIVREPSGLARSSRNTYLSAEEKERALALSRALASVTVGRQAAAEQARIWEMLEKAGLKPDYVEFADGETLDPVKETAPGTVVLLAAYCGKTRLIDNRVL